MLHRFTLVIRERIEELKGQIKDLSEKKPKNEEESLFILEQTQSANEWLAFNTDLLKIINGGN